MEVIIATLVFLLLSCCVKVTQFATEETIGTPATRYIRTGDTVNLSCDINHMDKTMWYGQKINRSPFIIVSAEMTSGHKKRPSVKFYWGYNSRINVTWNPTHNSIGLTIENINESDEGFYFCTVINGIFLTPGSGQILILEEIDSYSTFTTTSVSTAGQVILPRESGQCGLVWSLVAILCSTSILLTALVFLIIQKKRRRGTESRQTGRRTRQDENLEEDEVSTVQYIALP